MPIIIGFMVCHQVAGYCQSFVYRQIASYAIALLLKEGNIWPSWPDNLICRFHTISTTNSFYDPPSIINCQKDNLLLCSFFLLQQPITKPRNNCVNKCYIAICFSPQNVQEVGVRPVCMFQLWSHMYCILPKKCLWATNSINSQLKMSMGNKLNKTQLKMSMGNKLNKLSTQSVYGQ